MVHWAFSILAFIIGFVVCYSIIYCLARLASRIEGAIAEAAKSVTVIGFGGGR